MEAGTAEGPAMPSYLYRSEAFAEDLLPAAADASVQGRRGQAWLQVTMPLLLAVLGATLVVAPWA